MNRSGPTLSDIVQKHPSLDFMNINDRKIILHVIKYGFFFSAGIYNIFTVGDNFYLVK